MTARRSAMCVRNGALQWKNSVSAEGRGYRTEAAPNSSEWHPGTIVGVVDFAAPKHAGFFSKFCFAERI